MWEILQVDPEGSPIMLAMERWPKAFCRACGPATQAPVSQATRGLSFPEPKPEGAEWEPHQPHAREVAPGLVHVLKWGKEK